MLKTYLFPQGKATADAKKLVMGEESTIRWREAQGWGVKKALVLMLDCIPSMQVRWTRVTRKGNAGAGGAKPDPDAKWNPTPEEVRKGK